MDCGQAAVLLSLLYYTDAAIEMTGPTTYTAMLGTDSQIPCTFTSDKPLTDSSLFAVIWYHDKKTILSTIDKEPYNKSKYSLSKDQALKGTANLTIYSISMADSVNYTCRVSYELSRSRTVKVDIQASPRITIVNNAVMTNNVSFLCCEISGFYPVDINITWFRDGEILDNVLEGKPRKNPNGTYSVFSSIILTSTEEDRGRNFSCSVEHVSLRQPLKKDISPVYGGEKEPHTNAPECHKAGFITAIVILTCICVILAVIILCLRLVPSCFLCQRQSPDDPTKADRNTSNGEPNGNPEEENEMLPRRMSSEESSRRRQRSS